MAYEEGVGISAEINHWGWYRMLALKKPFGGGKHAKGDFHMTWGALKRF